MADREMTNEEAIEILGGIRACYNIFDEYDEPKYAALSKAIFALKAEPKHGQWIEYVNSHCECPFCHSEWSFFDNDTERFDYCPNCGAQMMDEVEE